MPQTVEELIDILSLERIDEGTFEGRSAESPMQRVFGGQVLAQALSAGYQSVGPGRLAHSVGAYFLREGRYGVPITYRVEQTRDGRSFSTRLIQAEQLGRTIFSMVASFHDPEPGLNHADTIPPNVPAPEDCPQLSEVLGARSRRTAQAWRQEWGVLDTRFASDTSALASQGGPAEMKVWLKVDGDLPGDPRLHQAMIAYASDLTLLAVSTVPHPVQFAGPGMQIASINHSMWFHRAARADQWLLYDEVSPSASAGLGFSFGRMFSGSQLAVSCAQEGLIRLTDQAALAAASGGQPEG